MMNAGFPWFPKKAVAYHSFAVASEKSFGDCVPTEVLGKCNAPHLDELRRVCQIGVENLPTNPGFLLRGVEIQVGEQKMQMSTANELVDYGSSVHGWMILSDST